MKAIYYICLNCGYSIEIEYNEALIYDHVKECPSCKTPIDKKRLQEIIHDILNPPVNNPTQEYYTDKENNDKNPH